MGVRKSSKMGCGQGDVVGRTEEGEKFCEEFTEGRFRMGSGVLGAVTKNPGDRRGVVHAHMDNPTG